MRKAWIRLEKIGGLDFAMLSKKPTRDRKRSSNPLSASIAAGLRRRGWRYVSLEGSALAGLPASTELAIALGVSSTEPFAVRGIARPIMIRIIRVGGSAVAEILLTSI